MKDIKTIFLITAATIVLIFAFLTNNKNFNNNYEEATPAKIEEFNTTNPSSTTNHYSFKSIDKEEIARLYYNDYKNMIVNYPDEAYEQIVDSNVPKEKFLAFREDLIKNYYSYYYVSYNSYEDKEINCYVYRVTDNKGNIFRFSIYSAMQYDVSIKL